MVSRSRTHTPGHPTIGPGSRSASNHHITYGHEAEAKAAQRAKKPSRVGLIVLKLLGYRGPLPPAPDVQRATPRQRRNRHPR